MHHRVPINVSIITDWKSLNTGCPGVECFHPPQTYQMSYVFLPPALFPKVPTKFLADHITGKFRLLILVSPCWVEAPWLPTVLNMLADIPHWYPIIKDLDMDVSVGCSSMVCNDCI